MNPQASSTQLSRLLVIILKRLGIFVNILSGEANEGSRDGVPYGHLGETSGDHCDEDGLDGVGEEQGAGASLLETTTDADEEGGSDGTANGDEL